MVIGGCLPGLCSTIISITLVSLKQCSVVLIVSLWLPTVAIIGCLQGLHNSFISVTLVWLKQCSMVLIVSLWLPTMAIFGCLPGLHSSGLFPYTCIVTARSLWYFLSCCTSVWWEPEIGDGWDRNQMSYRPCPAGAVAAFLWNCGVTLPLILWTGVRSRRPVTVYVCNQLWLTMLRRAPGIVVVISATCEGQWNWLCCFCQIASVSAAPSHWQLSLLMSLYWFTANN